MHKTPNVDITHGLPEGKEDNQLDAQHLQEGLVLGQVILELNVELDHHEHGHGDGNTLESQHPDMRILGT